MLLLIRIAARYDDSCDTALAQVDAQVFQTGLLNAGAGPFGLFFAFPSSVRTSAQFVGEALQ